MEAGCPRCAGRETLLDEDLDEAQVEEELAPLAVQLAYAGARLGHSMEAISAYEVRALISLVAMPDCRGERLGLHDRAQMVCGARRKVVRLCRL